MIKKYAVSNSPYEISIIIGSWGRPSHLNSLCRVRSQVSVRFPWYLNLPSRHFLPT